jgi:pimeloyl-ACP methyl ester carboxylesterase
MSKPVPATLSRRHVLVGAVAAAATAGASLTPRIAAATKRATFVLVHGAWHGGWCWRRVADRLTAKGHYVVAPTLSGVCERSHLASESIDLTTQIYDVVNEIKWKDLDGVVLVGHSYGGCVITGVAEQIRDRIASIVYLDAFLPQDGQSLSDMLGPAAPQWPEVVALPIPAAAFQVNEKDRAWVDSKMTPHPVRCFTEKLTVTGANQTVARKLYIRALDFANPAFDAALERCKADPTWRTISMKCGHDVMIDQPAELTANLQRLA